VDSDSGLGAGLRVPARAERTRRAVAALTASSWQSIPHFYLSLVADLTVGLERARPMTLVCATVAHALRLHPECNLEWDQERPVRRGTIDLGILVDTPAGLILPMVRTADRLATEDLTAAIRAAADRARAGQLRAEDFGTRSLAVSNLGMYAVDQFDGVIAAPDMMLLSIGRTRVEPRLDGDRWVPRTVATLTLAVDHRAMDGAAAARLISTVDELLRDPDWILELGRHE
jgi:pyruvate dehydrogenase E2 component (dihydrolipoamide acetyltransferase)